MEWGMRAVGQCQPGPCRDNHQGSKGTTEMGSYVATCKGIYSAAKCPSLELDQRRHICALTET